MNKHIDKITFKKTLGPNGSVIIMFHEKQAANKN